MEIIANTTQFNIRRETAAALGKFDGIHIGHRRLLEEILSRKKDGLAACVFTFDPPPAVFFGIADGKELTTREEKRLLFERMGVDILIEFPMNAETAAIPAETFAEKILAQEMKVRFLAAGTDLSFGAGGAGNTALLHRMAPSLGFQVKTIEKVCFEGQEVSSSLVRNEVEKGNMEQVRGMLGMPYLIAGEVVRGRQLGRALGFPTVNVSPTADKLLPPNGVYFSTVCHKGNRYASVSNVGYKPTVAEERVMGIESYLYDFHEDIYGEPVEIYLHSFRRPERRFEDVCALREQLRKDIAAGEAYDYASASLFSDNP